MMRSISIIFNSRENRYDVVEDGLRCESLCWDEMLAQIAEMTHPKIGVGRYPMLKKDD